MERLAEKLNKCFIQFVSFGPQDPQGKIICLFTEYTKNSSTKITAFDEFADTVRSSRLEISQVSSLQ